MSVYVDPAIWEFGRMKMCHMIADTSLELVQMADRIGVKRRWIQKAGTPEEHFDMCRSKRRLVVLYGAVEIESVELVVRINKKRAERVLNDGLARVERELLK